MSHANSQLQKQLKDLKPEAFLASMSRSRDNERNAISNFLHHLAEAENRKIYAHEGFSSLHAYCIEKFDYDPASADRRILASRALRQLPELEKKLSSGQVTLTTLAQMQRHIQRQENQHKQNLSKNEKISLFKTIEDKSARDVEKSILKLDPTARPPRKESIRLTGNGQTTAVHFQINEEERAKLDRLKDLYFHRNPNPTLQELFNWAMDTTLEKFDPKVRQLKRKKLEEKRSQNRPRTNPSKNSPSDRPSGKDIPPITHETKSLELFEPKKPKNPTDKNVSLLRRKRVAIPIQLRDQLLSQHSSCQYKSPSGKICGSTRGLQIDHIHPFSRGGSNDPKNLQVLCWKHNAIKSDQLIQKAAARGS